MRKGYIAALVCVVVLAFTSCGGKKGTGMSASHVKIPKDVSAVMALDMKQLQSKSYNLKDLVKGELAKKAITDKRASDLLAKAIDALDTDQKAYFFLKEGEKGSYYALSFVLKDVEKFKKLFNDAPIKPEFKKEGDIQLAMLTPLLPIAIGFKGKTALIMGNQSIKSMIPKKRSYGFDDDETSAEDEEGMDDADEEDNAKKKRERLRKRMEARKKKREQTQANTTQPMSEDEFKKTFLSVFKTSAAESLQETAFLASEAHGYDLSFWYDLKALQDLQKAGMEKDIERMTESYPFLKEMMKMNGTAYAGVKFEKGEVIMEGASHLDKEIVKKYGGIMKTGADKLGRTIPINQPTGFFSLSVDVNAIYNLLKDDKKTMAEMEENMRETEMKPKEFFDMFDGNLVIAAGDFDAKKIYGGSPESIDAVFALGLNKKDGLKKLIKKGIAEKTLVDKGNGVYQFKSNYREGDDKPSGFMIEKGNMLYMVTNTKLKEGVTSGKSGLDATKMRDNVYTIYVDIQRILKSIPTDKEAKVFTDKLKDLSATVSPIKNDIIESKFVLRFNDSKNALLIISDMVQKAAEMNMRGDLSMR